MGDPKELEAKQPAVRPKIPLPREPEREAKKTNPKPIEIKVISFHDDEGNKQHLQALHPSFVHQLDNFSFLPLPASPGGDFQPRKLLGHSIERLNDFELDLHLLLRLPYHRFWSTIMYDKSVNIGLRSYINNSPRFYFSETSLDERINEVANSIHKLVFKVYLRLSTTKESPKNFMSKDYFGKILMEKKIFDISLLMDICALYGNIHTATDEKLIRMVESVLESHPCFLKQLESSVNIEKEKMTKILEELGLSDTDSRSIMSSKQSHRISIINWSHLVGVVDHIVGTTVPVSFFLSLYPPASKVYREKKYDSAIVEFYDSLFPKLKEELNSRFTKDARAKKSSDIIIRQIVYARCSLINAFRSLVKYSALDILLDPSVSKDSKTTLIDDFLDMVSIAASSSCFSKDYFSKYSFDSDIFLFMEKSSITGFDSVDPSRIAYLFDVMSENISNKQQSRPRTEMAPMRDLWNKRGRGKTQDSTNQIDNDKAIKTGGDEIIDTKVCQNQLVLRDEEIKRQGSDKSVNKESGKIVSKLDSNVLSSNLNNQNKSDNSSLEMDQMVDKVMLVSMISHIKDFFPDMSDDTIQSMLAANNYNSEKVIDLILNEKIPQQ
ncbi:activating signal cointegrator 1 complex subunit 2 [Brevipalpus obovatus]|uniref:activating signal cointegrator 1 complex subunit 2 n=1 Tax=Brevipalpus obovatus TaxID=246614 RepID=UPI003D9F55B9